MDDILINFGGEIKSLGEGKFGGYLVRFTDATKKDLAGDYFTKATDFGIQDGETKTSPVWFHHRVPLETRDGKSIVIKTKIGDATLSVDEDGVLIDAILYNREKHQQIITQAGNQKNLGWSSGTASHLVDRDDDGHIKTWPLGFDASLTPIPCDPQNCAIPVKTYASLKFQPIELPDVEDEEAPTFKGTLTAKLNQHIDDLVDDGHSKDQIIHTMAAEAGLELGSVKSFLEGEGVRPTDANLKAFCRALKIDYKTVSEIARIDYRQSIPGRLEEAKSAWELEEKFTQVISDVAGAAKSVSVTGAQFDLKEKVSEACVHYKNHREQFILTDVEAYLDTNSDEPFYLKAIITDPTVSGGLDLDEHSQLAVSVLREVTKRFRVNHEKRIKSGRVLSEKNRQRISERLKEIQTVMDDLNSLLDESTPMASEQEKSAAQSTFLRLRRRAVQLGV